MLMASNQNQSQGQTTPKKIGIAQRYNSDPSYKDGYNHGHHDGKIDGGNAGYNAGFEAGKKAGNGEKNPEMVKKIRK